MKPTELRIGNIVNFEQRPHQIKEAWEMSYPTVRHYDPIPLTEDWLIRFGFSCKIKQCIKGEFKVYEKGGFTYDSNCGLWFYTLISHQPQYVHELQNLFFAITDEKLILQS